MAKHFLLSSGLCALLASCASHPRTVAPLAETDIAPVWSNPCVASLTDSALRPDTTYARAYVTDTTSRVFLAQVDAIAARVSLRVRRLLGAAQDSIPRAEPLITWRNFASGNLLVIAHRDGRVSSRRIAPSSRSDTLVTRLLERALEAVVVEERIIGWPSWIDGDSLALRLTLGWAEAPGLSSEVGHGFPAFVIHTPTESRPQLIRAPGVPYPEFNRLNGVNGHIVMEAIIDTAGRSEPSSVHDLWPSLLPRLQGRDAVYYRAFVRAATDAVLAAVYSPGRIGGCPVRVRVQIPINFTTGHDARAGP